MAEFWELIREPFFITLKIVAILIPLMLGVAYLTFAERKIIGYMQVRIGPNRVGPRGWLQPIADALKLLMKEIVIPTNSNRFLFLIAPMISLAPALAAAFGVQLTMAVSGSVLSLLALAAWRTGRSLDETRQFSVETVETGTVADEPITPVP